MNKERLIEKMREAVNPLQPSFGVVPTPILAACAEVAAKHFEDKWVRTYKDMRGDMMHRKTLYICCKEFSYVFKGYYDCIIGVFKSDDNPIFDGNFHNVTHYQYEEYPEPPKDK